MLAGAMSFDRRSRPLFAALLLSLGMHLVLLFGAGFARHLPVAGDAAPLPLRVVVRSSAPPPAPVPPEQRPSPPNGAARAPVRGVAVGKAPMPAKPASVVSPTAAVDAQAAPPSSEPVAALAASVGTAAATDVVAAPAVSADGLRQYRLDLASAARRFRAYPALARARGWEGVAEVTIAVSPGLAPALHLSRSSGHAVLDDQALAMLARAAAQTPLPASLQGGKFVVPLPIRFSLED